MDSTLSPRILRADSTRLSISRSTIHLRIICLLIPAACLSIVSPRESELIIMPLLQIQSLGHL